MKGIVIILGSPNDEQGNLSEIAVGRNNQGIKEYHDHPGFKILVTGGYGNHFNTTDKPHAYYAKQYLLSKGISKDDILELVESHDTVEDALLSRPVVEQHKVKNLIIVTSDFHMARVEYIFSKVFKEYDLIFSAAPTKFPAEQYQKLQAHEQIELEKLKSGKVKVE